MDVKGVRTGYLLGISLLLSSIFYFFASSKGLTVFQTEMGIDFACCVITSWIC
ncbi:hypothetical protein [Gracilibacillus alcaliphilus]|uniref:hypothetical protein n=1 Tax=Gracilibacillus alcaliphilus TaxID=1401441 RepID=UPI00195BFC40|nr:hypothetical protein [Gracilibacillus alcaliphilus]MBM7678894.1 hypothetical protein [Gracilibacillus alcaliphilus]